MGNIPQQPATSQLKISGRLQFIPDGAETPIDLGTVDIPLTLNIGGVQQHHVYRGQEVGQSGITIENPVEPRLLREAGHRSAMSEQRG